MANISEQRMNLAAVQRVDSKIGEIVDNASQVALYKFDDERNEWEKTEIEGTLFVYHRSQDPHYGFIVMNRLNTNNFTEPINAELDFQLQTPFLLYKNSKGSIYGIWFYNREECVRIENILLGLSGHSQGSKIIGRQRCVSEGGGTNSESSQQNDILSLLSQAQQEYDKINNSSKAPPVNDSKPRAKFLDQEVIKPTPVRASNANVVEKDKQNVTPSSVAKFFAQYTATQKRSERNQATTRNPIPRVPHRSVSTDATRSSESTAGPKNIQHILANPANKLEHIEKLQQDQSSNFKEYRSRATSCSASMGPFSKSQPEVTVQSLELDIKEKLKLIPAEIPKVESLPQDIPKPRFMSQCFSHADTNTIMTPAMFDSSLKSSCSPQFSHFPLGTSPCDENHMNEISLSNKPPDVVESPLLSPLAFTKPLISKQFSVPFTKVQSSPEDATVFMNGYQKPGNRDCNLLLPDHIENHYSVPLLTKDQLRESLIFLLKNDGDFLSKIHDAYSASLNAGLSWHKM